MFVAMGDLEAEAGDTLAEDILVTPTLVGVILTRGCSLGGTMESLVISIPPYIIKPIADLAGLVDYAGVPDTG
jgi:hypothetical protein